ncbi:class I SAM-dependent DNA methyltransferase [Actinokineospora fastidiosa]|uniref:Methyltransferase n=1 Tax=Actinokineospora fastidiosa TaxID=1816 RepID=A0A918GRC7_9PSEU|nr:methyltransferase domain-containing protein [Actinokineospora fastidiosa]GGS52688.1 methyltransferase [Actinokineospora fastidiosa]
MNDVRASYDKVAADYAALLHDELAGKPFDRAMLATFAELVDGPVVEVGCGPGRIAAHLHGLGVDVSGIDLSPGMVAVARRTYPGLRFAVGTMTALDIPDTALRGVVAWYSICHTPLDDLPAVFVELHRVLAPGGLLLLAFKAGDRKGRLSHAYGHDLSLDVHWHPPERVAAMAADAGFTESARLVRAADGGEKGPQAYYLGRR